MSDELKPALTPEEWRAALDNVFVLQAMALEAVSPERGNAVRGIALLNAALPDDSSYKITRKDVYVMECAASAIRAEYGSDDEDALELDRLAAKLNALLPPEKPAEETEVERRERLTREVFSTPIGTRVVIDGKWGTVTGNLPNGVVVVQFDDPLKG